MAAQILQGDSISTWMASCYFPHGGAGGLQWEAGLVLRRLSGRGLAAVQLRKLLGDRLSKHNAVMERSTISSDTLSTASF